MRKLQPIKTTPRLTLHAVTQSLETCLYDTMSISTTSFFVILASATVFSMVTCSDSKETVHDEGLRLDSYSEKQVKGCYIHNQTVGVCFDVQKGSIHIQKTTRDAILFFLELDSDMIFYQVLDQAFVGYGPSMFYVPEDVPRKLEALQGFVKDISKDKISQHELALKNHYQAAMSELRHIPEVQLFERVSAALGNNSTRLEILQPFHILCFNLLKKTAVELPHELKAAPGMEDWTDDRHDREKRCSQPREKTCRGLCGIGCKCWSWICGDCCWHRGCDEHDRCCRHNFYSKYCLVPTGLTCSGFPSYPKCLRNNGWWK